MMNAQWICNDWIHAHIFNSHEDWKRVCDCLYGAVQACIMAEANEDYSDYKTLLKIAREYRLKAIAEKYKEAA